MRSSLPWFAALLVSGIYTCVAAADYPMYYPPSVVHPPRPPVPDMCNPGFYSTNCCGAVYRPNYYVRPPFPPYNGERPCLKGPGGPTYLTHPYARGPRDYFMLD